MPPRSRRLIIFGLASVPLVGPAAPSLMALLGAAACWFGVAARCSAGSPATSVTDPALNGWFSEAVLHQLHIWGGPVGGFIVLGLGYIIVGQHRRLILDEILAGIALLIWIIVDRVSDSMFGGADPDVVKIWMVRGVLILVMSVAYAVARKQWHVEEQKV
jgi:hypothetical protein